MEKNADARHIGDIAELFGKFAHSHFGADNFLVLGHVGVLRKRHGSKRASEDTVRRIKVKLLQIMHGRRKRASVNQARSG